MSVRLPIRDTFLGTLYSHPTETASKVALQAVISLWTLFYTAVLILLSLISATWTVPVIFLDSVTANFAAPIVVLLAFTSSECSSPSEDEETAKEEVMGIRRVDSGGPRILGRWGRDAETFCLDSSRRINCLDRVGVIYMFLWMALSLAIESKQSVIVGRGGSSYQSPRRIRYLVVFCSSIFCFLCTREAKQVLDGGNLFLGRKLFLRLVQLHPSHVAVV